MGSGMELKGLGHALLVLCNTTVANDCSSHRAVATLFLCSGKANRPERC